MKQIRRKVFETNSSSSHSITISNSPCDFANIKVDKNNNVNLNGGEFGWRYETYRDAITKANYCAVYCLLEANNEDIDMLKEVIKQVTNCNEVILDIDVEDYDSPNYSYIDHQSKHVAAKAFENEKTLKRFIFNPNSILITDNDNR